MNQEVPAQAPTMSRVLVYKRTGDPERPVFNIRPLRRPLLAKLFGWICDWVMQQKPIDKQPDALSWYRVSNGTPNELTGEVELELWKAYVNSYNGFRTLEREVVTNMKSNARIFGTPIGTDFYRGTLYDSNPEHVEFLKNQEDQNQQ